MAFRVLLPKSLVSGDFNQCVQNLVPQLKIKIQPRHRNLKNIEGPLGRIKKLRQTVTALVKYERIELFYNRADEARGYAERLITEAIRHGDTHPPTMDMACFWLDEKQLVHKLFKVLAPRYKDFDEPFSTMHMLPINKVNQDIQSITCRRRVVLELKGNPFPPIEDDFVPRKNFLTNILLKEAKKEFYLNRKIQDSSQ